jgi:hypothetical protein
MLRTKNLGAREEPLLIALGIAPDGCSLRRMLNAANSVH